MIDDLLRPGLSLVFCGTALSRASYQARAYYAKPGNRFWPTLAQVGLTPRRFQPGEYPELLDLDIGLTDLCKLHYGQDDELPPGSLDAQGLLAKLAVYRPLRLAFTSKNAAQAVYGRKVDYGQQKEPLEGAQVWVLPSPSGLATRFWNVEVWQALADEVRKSAEVRPVEESHP